MKKQQLFLLLILPIIVLQYSCSKSPDVQWSTEDSEQSSSFIFSRFGEEESSGRLADPGDKTFVIVAWDEWGRHSKDCGGWGLCNAEWFYCIDDNGVRVPCMEHSKFYEDEFAYITEIWRDYETSEYFIEILFAAAPLPTQELHLPVDLDIIIDTHEGLGFDLTIKAGLYRYEEAIGDYGGIRVPLMKIE